MTESSDLRRHLEEQLAKEPEGQGRFSKASVAWEISTQLRALREARGLTQQQVAERAGMRQQSVSRLENPAYTGRTLESLYKVLHVLNASLDVTIVPEELKEQYVQVQWKPVLMADAGGIEHAAAASQPPARKIGPVPGRVRTVSSRRARLLVEP